MGKAGENELFATALINEWREKHWPPGALVQFADLPLYIGTHEQAAAFAEHLAELNFSLSSHIEETHNGKKPRWMEIPKLKMNVKAITVSQSTAKSSRSFESIAALEDVVGRIGAAKLDQLLLMVGKAHANGKTLRFVAHKQFEDLRAYIYQHTADAAPEDGAVPERVRFWKEGLVISPPSGVSIADMKLNDHRKAPRKPRSDAYTDPVLITAAGWRVYAKEMDADN